ncbi:hypothetical protein LIER_13950 [Lithospermum erythrorhizon]|uniref:Uncharacterized protein n=1 Tax=Lithospermum erythrorhizon TaxID=34254 RepID=A0AAV3PYW2_LITER
MVVSANLDVEHIMGKEEALIELGIIGDVERALAGCSVLELLVKTPLIVTYIPLIEYLQCGEFSSETNKISLEEINNLKIGTAMFSDVQVEHVVEMDIIIEFIMIIKSNKNPGDVKGNRRQLVVTDGALGRDFSLDPEIECHTRTHWKWRRVWTIYLINSNNKVISSTEISNNKVISGSRN